MKSLLDFLQFALSQTWWVRWIACIVLVYLLIQVWRLFKLSWRLLRGGLRHLWQFTGGWALKNWFTVAVLGTLLWLFSGPMVDLMQEIEQNYLSPVYYDPESQLEEAHLVSIYEAELDRHTDPYEKKIVVQRTAETAAKIRSTPLAIYEAAWLECALNPFQVRSDKVAAGWIQFTRAGIGGLRHKGQPVTYDEVLRACSQRDIRFIMDLSEAYLIDKYQRAGQIPLDNTIDLYLAIFAPKLIGADRSQVLYEGWNNPRYYKNSGLDGWYVSGAVDGRRKIFHKTSAKDGKITIWEVFLCLETKKNTLVRRYRNND
jgi:hypothetical protein